LCSLEKLAVQLPVHSSIRGTACPCPAPHALGPVWFVVVSESIFHVLGGFLLADPNFIMEKDVGQHASLLVETLCPADATAVRDGGNSTRVSFAKT